MKLIAVMTLGACVFTAPVWAQDAEDVQPTEAEIAQTAQARAVLEACSDALAQSGAGSAGWLIDGIAPDGPFAEIKPSGFGQVLWIRDADTQAARFTGQISRTAKAEPETVNVAFTPGKVTTLLTQRTLLVERNPDARPHESLVTARKLMMEFWVEPRPFGYELDNAVEMRLVEEAKAGGEDCDVVEIKLPELTAPEKRAMPRRSANLIRVYVARSDSLPRKIEAIAHSPFISIGESIELTNVTTGLSHTTQDILHTLPDGWRVDSTLTGDLRTRAPGAANPTPPTNPASTDSGASGQRQTPTSVTRPQVVQRPQGADFTFTTDDGREINNQTQRGRVTVLYFWGTWCMPCREFSPLVSSIAANAAEAPLDVFGIAVRERNPDTARATMRDGEYAHALVLGADNLAREFRVRVYPTIVVLDKQGRVVKVVRPEAGKTAEQTMTDVTNAVEIAANE